MKKPSVFYATASQTLITIHHVKDLMTQLRKKDLEVLFFRGISLIGDVYPSVGERAMLDVDILVKERDRSRVEGVLKAMGLEEMDQGSFGKTGFAVDVHTSFLNLSRTILERSCLTISIGDVFSRSITKKLDGIEIRIPSPVHLFISTAVHLQSHSFVSEKGWKDLVRIKHYYGLSDDHIFAEAQSMGAERILFYLSTLQPKLFSAWKGKLSPGERWVLKKIKAGRHNQNFGDLLFLFHSKRKIKSLQEIFFSQGFSPGILYDKILKSARLLKDTLFEAYVTKN